MKSNFPKSVVEKNDYGDVTYKKVFGPKWPALVAFTLALLSDLFAFIYVLVKGGGFGVFVFPLLLFVMTAVMLVISVFTDYRFKYSLLPVVLYIVLSAVTMGLFTYLTVANVDVTVSAFGYIFLGATYILTYVFCTVSVFGGNGYSSKQKRTAGICTALLTAVSAFSIFGYFTFGFYGQGIGIFDKEMILVYNYDSSSESYEASGILAGRGDTLIVPAEFNGKPVSRVSCDLFLHSGITTVRFVDGAKATLTDTDLLFMDEVESLPTVIANVDLVNHYREQFFDFSVANGANAFAMALCNSFRCDIDETKTELHFEYDLENFPLGADPEFIPVFVLDKGTRFNLSDFVTHVPYFGYVDPTTAEELAKAYSEISGYCLYNPTLVDDSTVAVDGSNLENDIYKVALKFDRVYLVNMEDGNDSLYAVPDKFKQTVAGDTTYNGMFVRASAISEYLSILPERSGFTVGYTAGGVSVKNSAQALGQQLENNNGTVTLVPTWTVIPPVISSLTSDKNGYVYGDSAVVITANVSCALDVKYAFYYEDGEVALADGVENIYTIANPIPSNTGTYSVGVYVEDATTALTCAPVVKELAVNVSKKNVTTTWTVPDGQTYNTNTHAFSTEINGQAVGTDELTLSMLLQDREEADIEVSTIVNAGRYRLTAAFVDSSLNELYVITNPVIEFSIKQYDANVTWNLNTAVYSGNDFTPTVAVNGVEGASLSTTLTSNPGRNAGKYTATFAFDSLLDKRNYNVNYNHPYEITPKPITANYGTASFVYNAQDQWTSVTSFNNLCGTDEIDLNNLIYTGKQTNVGSYIIRVALGKEVINYTLTNNEKSYEITPLAITVVPSDYTKTYDGTAVSVFETEVSGGLPGNDKLSEIIVSYNWGEAEGKMNVKTEGVSYYEIKPSVKQQGPKYGNYTITYGTAKYTVTVRSLQVSAVDKTHTYNGKVFTGFGVSSNGLASTDKIGDVISAFNYGSAATAINANTYTITPSVKTQGEKYTNYDIVFVDGTLTINKRALTVTADNKTKTYDASTYSDFTVTFSGLADTDTAAEVATYGFGSATAIVDAGNYTVTPALASQGAKYANYNITVKNGSFTVNKYAITVGAVAATKTYDGYVYTGFTVNEPTALPGSDMMSDIIFEYSYGAAETAINAGSHAITLSAKTTGAKYDNYKVTFTPSTLRIDKRAITVSVDDVIKTYDKQKVSFTVNQSGLAATDTLAEVASFAYGAAEGKIAAGTYAIELSVKAQGKKYSNYTVTFDNGTLIINKKALTLTAVDVTKTYDGKTSSFTVDPTGLVSGDTLASVVSAFTYGDAAAAVNAGSYTITLGVKTKGSAYDNYDITLVNGTLTVNKKDLRISPAVSSATYNGATHTLSVMQTGLVSGDTLDQVVTSLTYGDAESAINAGVYSITLGGTVDGAKSGNYNVSFENGTLTVNRRNLTLTPNALSVEYNGKTHTLSYKVTGLASTDNIGEIVTVFNYGEAQSAINAGTYVINLSGSALGGAKTSNYNVNFGANATLTIKQKAITVTVANATKVADGSTYTAFSVSASGLVQGDTLNEVVSSFNYGPAATATAAGTHSITLSAKTQGAKYGNYKITYKSGTLTITEPAPAPAPDDNDDT